MVVALATGLRGWLQVFAGHSFLSGSDEEAREMRKPMLSSRLSGCGWEWTMVYMRLRFSAIL
ncbi:hypothetical protein L208DRAFT_1389624, partial [Tricholoma matsutake]